MANLITCNRCNTNQVEFVGNMCQECIDFLEARQQEWRDGKRTIKQGWDEVRARIATEQSSVDEAVSRMDELGI